MSIIIRLITITMLVWSLSKHQYDYYIVLRWVVTAVSLYCSIFAQSLWVCIFAALAVLFNPIIPIHLTRELWGFIDIGAAILLFCSIFFVNEARAEKTKLNSELLKKQQSANHKKNYPRLFRRILEVRWIKAYLEIYEGVDDTPGVKLLVIVYFTLLFLVITVILLPFAIPLLLFDYISEIIQRKWQKYRRQQKSAQKNANK